MTKRKIEDAAYEKALRTLMELYLDLADLDIRRKSISTAIDQQMVIAKKLRDSKGQKILS